MSMNIGTDYRMYDRIGTSYGEGNAASSGRLNSLSKQQKTGEDESIGKKECQTCKNRKYQDDSSDPGVSFKNPQNLSPEQAMTAVMNHEYEHVSHARINAEKEGAKVVRQNVQIFTSICPECGRTYVSGGLTTTTTMKAANKYQDVAALSQTKSAGSVMDLVA